MNEMKEYKLDFKNHMGAWFIDEKLCDRILNYFYENPQIHQPGMSYFTESDDWSQAVVKPNKNIKDSVEILIPYNYFGKPFDEYRMNLQKVLNNYVERYNYLASMSPINVNENYILQTYPKGGGFKTWHCENSSPHLCKRVLAFETFLNDVPDGGTMFRDQDITVPAKKGLTLIWPAGYTHVHKGQITEKHEKQIITGWLAYDG